MLGGREVGIEAEETKCRGPGEPELVGGTVEAGEVETDFGFAGSAIEGGLPEFESFGEAALSGVDGREVGCGFERVGIQRQSLRVQRRGFGEIAVLLSGVSKGDKQRGIVGRIAERGAKEFFGLRLGCGHAAGNNGLPGECEVPRISRGIGCVRKGDQGWEHRRLRLRHRVHFG